MATIEHKWYDNIDQKGRAKIIFSFKRLTSKQIAKFTPVQRANALSYLERVEKDFAGFVAELKDLLRS